jgi:uncharacterized protein (DUF2147 family)
VLLVITGFISLWHMPLFFLVAGWSLHGSLVRRGAHGVLRERLGRLGVPLVVGCLLFMPVIKYLELSSGLDLNYAGLRVAERWQPSFRLVIPQGLPPAAEFTESFWEFLPTFFTRLERFTWAHLWFVAYLLTFTMALLPLLRWLQRHPRARAAWPRWIVYAPIVPLAVVQLTLRERWPGIQNLFDDWANVGYYTTYLLAGFLLARDSDLETTAQREWQRALGLGAAACVPLLATVLGLLAVPALTLAASAVAGWCFVLAALGLAHRFLAFGNAALAYLSEAAFPVYLLHQIAIVVPGYFIVQLPLGIASKFALVVATAVVLTFATYHFVVRPFTIVRRAFGMAARTESVPVARRSIAAGAALLAFVAAGPARAALDPVGRWYAEGGAAQVEIAPCGSALCGRVVWLRSPFDEYGCPLADRYNRDRLMQGRPVIGLEILRGLRRSSPGSWDSGTIYDPSTGWTYDCSATLDGPDRLLLRGYLGVRLLGRTTTWLRVGAEDRICQGRDDR